jgi:hypothetical protein
MPGQDLVSAMVVVTVEQGFQFQFQFQDGAAAANN